MDNNNGPSVTIFVEATEYSGGKVSVKNTLRSFTAAQFSTAPSNGQQTSTYNWTCPICLGAGYLYAAGSTFGGGLTYIPCGGCNSSGTVPKPAKIIQCTKTEISRQNIYNLLNGLNATKGMSFLPANPPTVLTVQPPGMSSTPTLVKVSDEAPGAKLGLPAPDANVDLNYEVKAQIKNRYDITIEAQGFTVTHGNKTKTVASKIIEYKTIELTDYDVGKYDFTVSDSRCTESQGSENQTYHCDHCSLIFSPPTDSQWRYKSCKIGDQNNPAATLGCIEAY